MKNIVQVMFDLNNNKDNLSKRKDYTYVSIDENLTVGDTVVVETQFGFSLARVVSIDYNPTVIPKFVDGVQVKEVVCRLDFAKYEERKKRENRLLELKRIMDTRVSELQNNAIYELLAEKDPALKKMLEEYKELSNK